MNDHDDEYSYINRDLDELAKVKAQLDLLVLSRDDMINSVIPEDVQNKIDDIEVEFAGKMAAAELNIGQLSHEIRQGVLELGLTVKGEHIMAVWNKGRESWDTKALKGYAAAHPDVLQLKKVGEPSVTIRKI